MPEQISVAGFDDTPMCTMISPAVTSVRQDGALRARVAMEKLKALNGKEEIETVITLPVTLMIRSSTRHRE